MTPEEIIEGLKLLDDETNWLMPIVRERLKVIPNPQALAIAMIQGAATMAAAGNVSEQKFIEGCLNSYRASAKIIQNSEKKG